MSIDKHNINLIAHHNVQQADPVAQMNRVVKVLASFDERIAELEESATVFNRLILALSKAMRGKIVRKE